MVPAVAFRPQEPRCHKYVSDKYAGVPYAPITIPPGASFKDMVALKGKSDIGDQINKKIVAPLAKANKLSDMPDFNDATKLGSGKEMVDRLTNFIAIFENKALDFSKNRAEGDDILGDAYEYLVRHVDLVGEHLGERSDDALPHLDLAGEAPDAAVLSNPQKGIEIGRHPLAEAPAAFPLRQDLRAPDGDKNEDPSSQDLEEFPAVGCERAQSVAEIQFQVFVFHWLFPPFMRRAADSTAITIRVWAPQRHKLCSMDARMSARLG